MDYMYSCLARPDDSPLPAGDDLLSFTYNASPFPSPSIAELVGPLNLHTNFTYDRAEWAAPADTPLVVKATGG